MFVIPENLCNKLIEKILHNDYWNLYNVAEASHGQTKG